MSSLRSWSLFTVGAVAVALVGCGDPNEPEPVPAEVAVTSPLDSLLSVGATAQLAATVRDADGVAMAGVTLTWSSSNGAAVEVDAAGLVTIKAAGSATITATTGSVSGTLRLRGLQADVAAVASLANDPFLSALVSGLTTSTRATVQAAVNDCQDGADSGRLALVVDCVADVEAVAAAASDGGDRALLGVLTLFGQEIRRRLSL